MDERLGRAAAIRFGLRVTGLIGVLIDARERGHLPDAANVVASLRHEAGFWISDDLCALILKERA